MNYRRNLAFVGALMTAVAQDAFPVDGLSVTTACRWTDDAGPASLAQIPERAISGMDDSHYQPGHIIRIDIKNSAVARIDTIYKSTFARWPVLNMEGTKVAFHRWSARVQNGVLVDQNLPSYIAVMDTSGQNVHNLAAYKSNQTWIDWPSGDWIYYTKTDSFEMWKVKWNDSTSAVKVCSFKDPKISRLWRWDIAADGTRALADLGFSSGGYTNVPHIFPFTTPPIPKSQGGTADEMISCNGCIAPSGKYIATYMTGGHGASTIARWDPGIFLWGSFANCVVVWLKDMNTTVEGVKAQNMEAQRWSTNSDQWMCLSATGGYVARWEGGNQVLSNWVTKENIMTTQNKYLKATQVSIVYYTLLGDFWIKPPAGKEGRYEDSSGNWISVGGVNTIDRKAAIPNKLSTGCLHVQCSDGQMMLTMPDKGEHRIELFGSSGILLARVQTDQSRVAIDGRTYGTGVAVARVKTVGSGKTEIVRLNTR